MILFLYHSFFLNTDAIENKLDNQASSLSKIDSLVTITNTIKDNVGSIDATYQEIRGKLFLNMYIQFVMEPVEYENFLSFRSARWISGKAPRDSLFNWFR